ncbi:MAG: hypothetical protein ACFB4I_14840 [Cyanophyceae cyanobacterium]
MLRTSSKLHYPLQKQTSIKDKALHFLQRFWQFSLYYGNYVANPPYKIQQDQEKKEREL